MTIKPPDQATSEQKRDPDLVNAEIALKRAANKAREIARKAGTSVIIFKDGEIREEQNDDRVHSGSIPVQSVKRMLFSTADSGDLDTKTKAEGMWRIAEKWRNSNKIYHSPVQRRRYRILEVTERIIQVERMDGGDNEILRMATVRRLAPTTGALKLRGENLSVAQRTTFAALWHALGLQPRESEEQVHTSRPREPE